jgi:hypothetical protein
MKPQKKMKNLLSSKVDFIPWCSRIFEQKKGVPDGNSSVSILMYRKNLPVQYLTTVVNGRFIEVDMTQVVYHFLGKIKIFCILRVYLNFPEIRESHMGREFLAPIIFYEKT